MSEKYIPKCPHCNDDIKSLEAFVLEENKYTVDLNQHRDMLIWSTSEVVESSEVRTVYRCGNCEKTLFTALWASDGPRIVIDFLKGVRMIWRQDALHDELYSELKRFNEQNKGVDGSYYGYGFPRGSSSGRVFGIYFVDPTSSARGMDPVDV